MVDKAVGLYDRSISMKVFHLLHLSLVLHSNKELFDNRIPVLKHFWLDCRKIAMSKTASVPTAHMDDMMHWSVQLLPVSNITQFS